MNSVDSSRARWRTILITGAALVATVVVTILVSARPDEPSSASSAPTGRATAASASPASPASSPAPTATVSCHEEPGPLAAGLPQPACPSAILAVELAVAPVRLPIERIVIEPGPFFCEVIWPGRQTPAVCFDVFVRAGQFMHGWVEFRGSPKVAAVMLGLDLPVGDGAVATRPPWNVTLVAVEIPPTGWVMP